MQETQTEDYYGKDVKLEELTAVKADLESTKKDLQMVKKEIYKLLAAIGCILIITAATSYSLFTAVNRIANLNTAVYQLQEDVSILSNHVFARHIVDETEDIDVREQDMTLTDDTGSIQ